MIDSVQMDECVDNIIASCNGDLHGALRALMLVNEQLENELQRVSALASPCALQEAGLALH